MGYGNYSTLVLLKMGFEPLDTLGIEVVGRLVEQKNVRLTQKQAAKGYPSALASGKVADLGIGRRTLQGIHCPFQLGIDFPTVTVLDFLGEFSLAFDEGIHPVRVFHHFRVAEGIVDFLILLEEVHHFLHSFLHYFEYGLVRIHLRFLLQIANGVARSPYDLALVGFLHTGYDFEQGGFTGAVETYDTDFGAIEE